MNNVRPLPRTVFSKYKCDKLYNGAHLLSNNSVFSLFIVTFLGKEIQIYLQRLYNLHTTNDLCRQTFLLYL